MNNASVNISFFIPAYNCASTIEEAVDSIIETNFNPNDELVIVDDCSTDDTAAILDRLQTKYACIKVISHKYNKGGAAARNTAIENAGNELLFCLDSDNVLAPSSIKTLKNYLLINDADVATFEQQHFFQTDKYSPAYIWKLPCGELSIDCYLTGGNTPGQHGNYLFTKQSWENAQGYAEGSGALDTWTFGLRQAITGAKMVVLKDTYYFHRLYLEKSYWMRDAEANLYSVSVKTAYALFPFYDLIDEKYLNYMLGKGRYTWFYNLKRKPLQLVQKGEKKQFYEALNKKIHIIAYPRPSLLQRALAKSKRLFNTTKW